MKPEDAAVQTTFLKPPVLNIPPEIGRGNLE
jgi:hypothetical protein